MIQIIFLLFVTYQLSFVRSMVGDPIIINGDPNHPATAECAGDLSCKGVEFQGKDIKDVKCAGNEACYESIWDIDCDDDGCTVECDGEEACSFAMFDVGNSIGVKCSDESCKYGMFFLERNIGGKVECDGELACSAAEISIRNIETFKCGAYMACSQALIGIIDPEEDFEMECQGVEGCQNADITISIPSDSTVTQLKRINCGEQRSCKDTKIMITNNGPNVVRLEELNCEATEACDGLEVVTTGDIVFENCKCGEKNGCIGATEIPSICFEN